MLQHGRQPPLRAFGVAVLAVAAATAARYLLNPFFGPTGLPYLFYFLAVAAVGLTGNLWAALFATLLAAVVANLLFVSPGDALVLELNSGPALVAFLIISGAVAMLTARLEAALGAARERARQASDRAEAMEEERASLQRESRRLGLLAEVANIGLPNPTFEEVAQHAARRIAEQIGDACVIRIREGDRLAAVAWHHVHAEAAPLLEAVMLAPDTAAKHPLYQRLFATRESFVASNASLPSREDPAAPLDGLNEKYGPRHAIGAPIVLGTEVIGAITVVRAQDEPYSAADRIAVEAVASRVALAMENSRLFEHARREAAEAREARATAEEASRVKDEFLATLSHELRTPLNAILGWAHMLREHDLPDDRRRTAVDTILRNAQSQEQLIADILEVQRMMAGKLRLEFATVDMGAIVRAAAETVQPLADAKRIKLQLLLDLDVTPIWGDPDRLQQVTWNLLSNAIKFTPPGGRVRVRLQQTDSDCQMIVEDTGPGIAPEFLPHVFERFTQADSSSTRVHKGLGLGLAITRNLIEMHGGTIEAANGADRSGAVFTIRLPRHRTAVPAGSSDIRAAVQAVPVSFEDGPSLHGTKVLVVDDNPDARELIGMVLGSNGAEVVVAASAEEAWCSLQAHLPHVVVIDIEMPHEDGYQFIRRVRGLPSDAGGRLPAVALTAYASSGDRVKALAAGFNMHVAKPVEPAELAMVVASLADGIGTRRTHEERPSAT